MTKWIQSAIKKPGALRAALKVKKGAKIPEEKLAAAAKKPGKIGQRARLAETLKSLRKGKRMAVGGMAGGTNTNEPAGPRGYGGTGNSGVSGGVTGGGGGQGGPAGGVRTGTTTGTSATNKSPQSEKKAPAKAVSKPVVKPPVVKPPVVAAPKPGLSYRYSNPLSPGYGPGSYWGGAGLYTGLNAPQDYVKSYGPANAARAASAVRSGRAGSPSAGDDGGSDAMGNRYRKGGMAKAKLTREEMKEFKGGKYMGGPAEEKAEKKKGKRMADGGLAGDKAPFGRDNLSPRARFSMENPVQGGFGRGNPPANMMPGRGMNRGAQNFNAGPMKPPVVQDYAAPRGIQPQISTPLPPVGQPSGANMAVPQRPGMRGGGIARKGVGQALAKGGLVKGAGCVQRGMKKPRYT